MADARAKARKKDLASRPPPPGKLYEITLKNAGEPGLPPPTNFVKNAQASLKSEPEKKQKKLKLPRVVSAHVSGHAVDVSAVAGIPIAGNQQPGGITEQTVRRLLALPDWLRPKQVISLLALGGPSFALPDHWNHIHIGY